MLSLLIDPCVWLDLAKDYRQETILSTLDYLIDGGEVALILPQQVVEEFARNRERIIKENQQSLASVFKRVKDAVQRFGRDEERGATLAQLNDVDHRIATMSEAVIGSIEHVERLFAKAAVIETSDAIKLRAADRAINRTAPFHGKKNSMGDAILLETFAEAVAARPGEERFTFVTHNTNDYSDQAGDKRVPHPDLAPIFAAAGVSYSTNLGAVLNEHAPDVMDEVAFEAGMMDSPRRLSELLEQERKFMRLVWYNRHWGLRLAIESGKHKVVTEEKWEKARNKQKVTVDTIWEGALAAAKRVEEEYPDEIGPWTDFEWGMLNGKLSAMRWAMGDEWDMLDT